MRGIQCIFFTATGTGFTSNITATVTINNVALGTVPTDGNGDLSFILSTANADEGGYVVTASVNPTASARFTLDAEYQRALLSRNSFFCPFCTIASDFTNKSVDIVYSGFLLRQKINLHKHRVNKVI